MKQQEKILEISMLVGAVLSCFVGLWFFGELYTYMIEATVGLTNEPISSMVPQIIALVIAGVIGTIILVLAIGLPNKKMRIVIIAFSVLIPTILEVIDMTIRSIDIYTKLTSNPELIIHLFQQ